MELHYINRTTFAFVSIINTPRHPDSYSPRGLTLILRYVRLPGPPCSFAFLELACSVWECWSLFWDASASPSTRRAAAKLASLKADHYLPSDMISLAKFLRHDFHLNSWKAFSTHYSFAPKKKQMTISSVWFIEF